jgi:hypothetical protein
MRDSGPANEEAKARGAAIQAFVLGVSTVGAGRGSGVPRPIALGEVIWNSARH